MAAMSIVVAVTKNDRTVMASDSMGFYGSQRVPTDNSKAIKVRRVGASLLAMTGWSVYDNIIEDTVARGGAPPLGNTNEIFAFFMTLWRELHERYAFVNDQAANKDSPFGDLDASFLIANGGGIFKVASDTNVSHFSKYYAIGSGSDYALGALYALYDTELDAAELASRAVEAAINFDTYCGGEIEVYDVRPHRQRARGGATLDRRTRRR